jgi:hypothetical protein
MPFRTLFPHTMRQLPWNQPLPHSFRRQRVHPPLRGKEGWVRRMFASSACPEEQGATPLVATLMDIPASVECCKKTTCRRYKSFRCNTYKKQGDGRSSFYQRSQRSTFKRSNDPPVPLRPAIPSATMSPGARFLRLRGKQLRPPRCLRIVSGHRVRQFDAVPIASRAWVHRSKSGGRPQQGGPNHSSLQDDEWHRAGKAGSVRLG